MADESPTAYACTVDTLREGKECIFETEPSTGAPSADQAAANVRALKEAAPALCAEAASPPTGGAPDRALVSLCERQFTPAAEACGLEGEVAVVDNKGRFAPKARSCYRGLARVLQDVGMMSAMGSGCCQCAAQKGCAGAAGDRCYTDVARQQSSPATLACMSERCAEACTMVVPASPGAAPSRAQDGAARQGSGAATP
ncbi:hypothetical protein P2318_16660 [Myxococcaceae bacterium GXIMD 01537]